jgi:hypothetical protein
MHAWIILTNTCRIYYEIVTYFIAKILIFNSCLYYGHNSCEDKNVQL